MGTRWNRLNEAVLTDAHDLCFGRRYEKISEILSEKLPFFGGKIFGVFE